jgi:GntR family transcriptional regulator
MELLQEMKVGKYAKAKRLPRELELAKEYNMSRSQLREILAGLEREGFITRLHGVGTIINHHVLDVRNRMDIEVEFMDMIRQNGYEPNITDVTVLEVAADEKIAARLQVEEGTELLKITRVCTADEKPAIYCEDYVEKSAVRKAYSVPDLHLSIFHFLKTCCYTESYMDLTQLRAVLADETVAAALQIPTGLPLLKMEEVDYDISGNIVFYSEQYFRDEYFEQTVLRKKL